MVRLSSLPPFAQKMNKEAYQIKIAKRRKNRKKDMKRRPYQFFKLIKLTVKLTVNAMKSSVSSKSLCSIALTKAKLKKSHKIHNSVSLETISAIERDILNTYRY